MGFILQGGLGPSYYPLPYINGNGNSCNATATGPHNYFFSNQVATVVLTESWTEPADADMDQRELCKCHVVRSRSLLYGTNNYL
jgi:hypothetical protein